MLLYFNNNIAFLHALGNKRENLVVFNLADFRNLPNCLNKFYTKFSSYTYSTVLEITVGHWPFSEQFQHLADQNPFWSANFTAHFQWDGNQ